jgi:SPOR domain
MAPRQGPAGEYYRIRVGPFSSKQEAEHIASGLKRGGQRVFLDEVPETALPPEASQPALASNDLWACLVYPQIYSTDLGDLFCKIIGGTHLQR